MSELKGNRGEWSELYTTLRLLAVGEIYAADENMEKIESMVFPVLKILREEKDKSRHYSINGIIKIIDPINNTLLAEIEKSLFLSAAQIVFDNITRLSGRSIHIQRFEHKENLIDFLQTIDINALKAKSTDKSDITIQIHDYMTGSTPILGFSIKSMIGTKSTLFNPAAGTNFIFKVCHQDKNAKIDLDAFNQLTYTSSSKIKHRILELEALNYNFEFVKVESQVLELNLKLIDGDLPKILAYMLKYRFSRNNNKIVDLLQILHEENPLNYNLEHGHPFYKYKIIKFLYDVALGMTPEVVWNGDINANGGIIVVKNDGEILAYHTYYKHKFEEYLFNNTMLEQSSTSEDENNPGYPKTKENYPNQTIKEYKYGWPYRVNSDLFFKLNLQVRFIK